MVLARPEPVDISDSRLNAWNFCPRYWALWYVHRWRPIVKSQSFNKGGWFHLGVETALQILTKNTDYTKNSVDELIAKFEAMELVIEVLINGKCNDVTFAASAAGTLTEEREEGLEEQRDTAIWMTMHYLRNLAPFLAHKLILGIEIKFEDVFAVPRPEGGGVLVNNRGIIDLLLYDPFDKTVHVVDHKSAADLLDNYKRLTYSLQPVGYVRWVKEMVTAGKHMDVIGSHGKVAVDLSGSKVRPTFRVVRNKMPRVPKTLKNGTISTQKISTVRSVYHEALAAQDTEPTEKQLDRLASLQESWTNTVEPVVTNGDITRWKAEMGVGATRMEQARQLPVYQTRNTKNCHECRLVNVCKMGDDPDFEQVKEENETTQ